MLRPDPPNQGLGERANTGSYSTISCEKHERLDRRDDERSIHVGAWLGMPNAEEDVVVWYG